MSMGEFGARVLMVGLFFAWGVVLLAVVPMALGAALAWWLRRKPPRTSPSGDD